MTGPNSAPVVREAATVMLLRDSPEGLQTWLLRRVARMAFAGGMSVFPGGAVDAADAGVDGDELAKAELATIAGSLGTSVEHATALVCAAIRETFEEVGVLLTRPSLTMDDQIRAEVEDRTRGFIEVLDARGLQLAVSSVRPWARWITPEGERRRYDTYFFVAAMPDGALALPATREAVHADWIGVHAALAEYHAGDRPMLTPTVTALTELAGFATVAEVLAAAPGRSLVPIAPVLRRTEAGLELDLGNGTVLPMPDGLTGMPADRDRT
ncbi:NUDIX domain-containing protein [Jatrophihabitans telluris]|uniref:NUDIX domain-containing protein n=1 Tax=Jatrophihabitans telluris TaxID=2038343 RepID=A0ABY4QZ87_9ACTN|nr:NUDIX domain-containing protein [Jatrophihabitans telluris]UQX88164.1 NUDIX domain-containing protein [Jatrophihabitans telluris]